MNIYLSPKTTTGVSVPLPRRKLRSNPHPGPIMLLTMALIARVKEHYRLADVTGAGKLQDDVVGAIGSVIAKFIDEHCHRQPAVPLAAPELCGIGYLFEAAADASHDHPLRQPFADAASRFFAAGGMNASSVA